MGKTKKVTIILICVLLSLWHIVSVPIAVYNAIHMPAGFVFDFSDYKLSFTLLANAALDYYEEAKNSYSDLEKITIYYQFRDALEITYWKDGTVLATKEVEDTELVAAYKSVEDAISFPDQRRDEPILYISAAEKQVDFRNREYRITYRSDLKKPDSDRYYVLRLSGLHWYSTRSKN